MIGFYSYREWMAKPVKEQLILLGLMFITCAVFMGLAYLADRFFGDKNE